MKKNTTGPRILITNDDGIDAPGIQALWRALRDGYTTLVVAPMYEKSGAGCSLSLSDEMEVHRREEDGAVWGYAVDGTPADCVKFAITNVKDFRPDFVLSGINRGMNVGNSVFYSGTVAGAIEATLFGIPSMACSLAVRFHTKEAGKFDDSARIVRAMLPWVMAQKHAPRTLWNLNMPNLDFEKVKRVRLTEHGTSFFADEFALYRQEGNAEFYKNVGSRLEACSAVANSDDRALVEGEASLSLLRTNLTIPFGDSDRTRLEREWAALLGGK